MQQNQPRNVLKIKQIKPKNPKSLITNVLKVQQKQPINVLKMHQKQPKKLLKRLLR